MLEFTVSPALNGFIVSIGCQTLVFTSNEALETAIHDYITAPEATKERFMRHSLHSSIDAPGQECVGALEPGRMVSI